MQEESMEDRASRLAGRAGARAEALAGEARDRAGDLARKAAPVAGHAYDEARDRARGAASALADTVEHQPLAVLLAVGLLGGALGFLLGRH
jgi:ElaB/YqjD/DUF883 family membrane-anchored ribosome-binding protein